MQRASKGHTDDLGVAEESDGEALRGGSLERMLNNTANGKHDSRELGLVLYKRCNTRVS